MKEDLLQREIDEFNAYMMPWGSTDIKTALEFLEDVEEGKRPAVLLCDLIEEFCESIGEYDYKKIDPNYVAYDYVLQMARNAIYEVCKYDFINDYNGGDTEIYTSGNYCCTQYDYSESAIEELKEKIKPFMKELKEESVVVKFLSELEIDL
jgi:hypothetical protein